MTLPVINTPTYELEQPSTKTKVKFRPFLVKEEKILLLALEEGDEKSLANALKQIINNCTFEKMDVELLPLFDLEYMFLRIRAKSVSEIAELKLLCDDDGETYADVSIPLEDIDVNLSEANLLHLFNFLLENNSKIMITSKIPIKKLSIKLADLKSRLLSLSQVNLGLPDDTLLSRVIIKRFSDKGVKIDMEVVNYLLRRMDRSFLSANNLVAKIDFASIQSSRKITIPFVRELLSTKSNNKA